MLSYNVNIRLISGQRGNLLLQIEESEKTKCCLTNEVSAARLLRAFNKVACATYHPTECDSKSFTPFPHRDTLD